MKRVMKIYTDGSARDDVLKWAFLVVDGEGVVKFDMGNMNPGGRGNFDVERAEAEAMKRAVDWARSRPDNYVMITDSKSLVSKICGDCANATNDPTVPYVRRTIEEFRRSPAPISFVIQWRERLSDEWMKRVDSACR